MWLRRRDRKNWKQRTDDTGCAGPFERWFMVLMADITSDGRRFRILTIIDDFTREAVSCFAERSISSRVVIRKLERIGEIHEKLLLSIMIDNSPEITSRTFVSLVQYR